MDAAADHSPARTRRRAAFRILGRVAVAVLAILAMLVVALSFVDWNRLRGPVARFASERSGLPVAIDGDLTVEGWTLTPRASVAGVRVANPAWMRDGGSLATVERATVEIELLPLLVGRLIVRRVVVDRPRLSLRMDESGRANWRRPEPKSPDAPREPPPDLPVVRQFVIHDGHLEVVDEKHELRVNGTLVAAERKDAANPFPFRVEGRGTLNREPFRMRVRGGPLVNLDPHEPYPFEVEVAAGRTHVAGQAVITRPFDLANLKASATMSGDDLADLFFLTGVALPASRPYELSASLVREGQLFRLPTIDGRVGGSDLRGRAVLDLRRERPRLTAELVSRELDLGDLAAPLGVALPLGSRDGQGTGRSAPRRSRQGPLLPDAELKVERIRPLDAAVRYRAETVRARRVPFRDFALDLKLEDGVLALDPVAFTLEPGRLAGRVEIDARREVPSTAIDFRITGLELAKVRFTKKARDTPPFEGLLQGRIKLRGPGRSVRAFAANADGSFTFVVPKGEVNHALAELTGIEVARGLGLLLKDKDEQTGLRCGVASFQVRDGTAEARDVVFDTDSVRIVGRGKVDLRREALDLRVQGEPKKPALLRLRSPIEIEGTFADPEIGVDAGRLAAQGGVAAALGALLTPLASMLAFVDPGLEKDANCSALLADAKARGAPVRTRVAAGPAKAGRDGKDGSRPPRPED